MDSITDLLFGPSSAYTHNGDDVLLRSLGLKTHGFQREPTPLGIVTRKHHGDHPDTKIAVSVTAMPAQFWRFEISEPFDRGGETVVVETGSGGFSDYWPTAEKIADGMLVVTRS